MAAILTQALALLAVGMQSSHMIASAMPVHTTSTHATAHTPSASAASEPTDVSTMSSCADLPPMAANASNIGEVLGQCFSNPANLAPADTSFMGKLGAQEACGISFAYFRFGPSTGQTEPATNRAAQHLTNVANAGASAQNAQAPPPLVLIQGSGMTMSGWTVDFLRELSQTREIIIFDNLGMGLTNYTNSTSGHMSGETEMNVTSLTIPGMAEDVFCLLSALSFTEADIFGFSMGGQIALTMTTMAGTPAAHGVKLRKAISSAGQVGGPKTLPASQAFIDAFESLSSSSDLNADSGASAGEMLLPFFFPASFPSEERSCLMCEYVVGIHDFPVSEPYPSSQGMAEQMGAMSAFMQSDSVWENLPNATTPLLLITGEDDEICPPENQDILAQQYGSNVARLVQSHTEGLASVKSWPMAGHGVQFSYTSEVVQAVNEFLGN